MVADSGVVSNGHAGPNEGPLSPAREHKVETVLFAQCSLPWMMASWCDGYCFLYSLLEGIGDNSVE